MPATLKNYPLQSADQPTKMPPLDDKMKAQRPVGEELTLKQFRDGIPAHYFKQKTMTGFYYVARDVVQIAAAIYAMYNFVLPGLEAVTAGQENSLFSWALYTVAWNLFWFAQGLSFTGLWVIAHECGHRAFSPNVFIGDCVGWVIHSALLVPYHAWRISHGTHHKKTNHITEDTVFVPENRTKKEAPLREAFDESPIASVMMIFVMLTAGWPAYLTVNAAGNQTKARCNHFEPSSPLFRPHQRLDIIISNIGMFIALAAIGVATYVFGFGNVMVWYGMPYLWTNNWLVLITFLHHTDPRIPKFNAEHWTFLRGAIGAVDRTFGSVIDWWLHYINNSHVVHHTFSTMPFYHAIEVTEKYVPKLLGDLYMYDDNFLPVQLYKCWRSCRYVVAEEGVSYFRQ